MSDVRSDPYQFPPEKMESLTTSVADLAVSEPQQPAPPQKDLTVIIPDDCWYRILSYVDAKTLAAFGLTSRRNFGVHLEWFLWYNHFMNDYGVSHSIGGAPSMSKPPGAVATPKNAGSATPPNCGPTATQPISSGWATTSPGSPTAPKCSPSLVLGHGIQTETSARRSIGLQVHHQPAPVDQGDHHRAQEEVPGRGAKGIWQVIVARRLQPLSKKLGVSYPGVIGEDHPSSCLD